MFKEDFVLSQDKKIRAVQNESEELRTYIQHLHAEIEALQ